MDKNKTIKINDRFGSLTVIEQYYTNEKRRISNLPPRCVCLCDCGNIVRLSSCELITYGRKSCGCKLTPRVERRRRGRTIAIPEREKVVHNFEKEILDNTRPKTRNDCKGIHRPCPWVGCKYNMFIDIGRNGRIIYNNTYKSPLDMPCDKSCLLDIVEKYGGQTLDAIGDMISVSRERVRQIEAKAIEKCTKLKQLIEEKEEYIEIFDSRHRNHWS
jgi:hypothetical protein